MWEIIGLSVTAIASIITAYFNFKNKKDSDLQKQINKEKEAFVRKQLKDTEDALINALATDITSVPLLRKKLDFYRKQLKTFLPVILLCLLPFLSGCLLFGKQEPLIIGERIFKPNPGDVITIPPLKKPAKQWYLMDNKAMADILGVETPVVPDSVIGVQEK